MKFHIPFLFAVAALFPATAGAEILLSSLADTPDSNSADGAIGGAGTLNMLGQAFTTNSNAWDISSIDLAIGSSVGTVDLSVELWSADVSGHLGSELYTLTTTTADFTGSVAPVNFTSTSAIALAADTEYFIVLTNGSTSGTTSIVWNYATSISYTGVGSIPATNNFTYALKTDGITNYGNGTPALFAVNGTAVPEPSTCAAILGLGALGLGALRRKSLRGRK